LYFAILIVLSSYIVLLYLIWFIGLKDDERSRIVIKLKYFLKITD
jgi:hypothetical protein